MIRNGNCVDIRYFNPQYVDVQVGDVDEILIYSSKKVDGALLP